MSDTQSPQPQPQPERRNLRDAPVTSMTDVVSTAAELRDRASRDADERLAALQTARELGLSDEDLERAASKLQEDRIARVLAKRAERRKVLALIGGSAVAGLGVAGGFWWWRNNQAEPIDYAFRTDSDKARWALEKNSASKASLAYTEDTTRGGVATVKVDGFANEPDGLEYYVNFNSTDGPFDYSKLSRLRFVARGKGLPSVRVYLENVLDQQRWRSQPFALTDAWQEFVVTIAAPSLERQQRQRGIINTGARWDTIAYRAPGTINRISFKLGGFVNDIGATGDFSIASVRVE